MGVAVKNTIVKVFLVIISMSLAFGMAEVFVRLFKPQEVAPIRFVFDPQLGEIPTPNQKGRKISPGNFDHTYSHNSLGFRGSKEYRYEKQTDHRILFLGDSFTYGYGVNDDQTFPFLTEKNLLEEHFSVEAINTGCSGRGTDFELKLFQVLGHKFHADLTVLCFTPNDYIDNERAEYYEVSKEGEITPKTLKGGRGLVKTILYYLPGYNWLISWSQAANLMKAAGVKWFLKTTDPTALKAGVLVIAYPDYKSGYANDNNKRLAEIYVKNLSKSVKEAGSSLMIFYVPMSVEVEKYRQEHAFSEDELTITAIARRQGMQIVSPTPMLAASAEPIDNLYFKNDGHWTALGNALVARYLSEQIGVRFTKH